jgi:hypothetical protein
MVQERVTTGSKEKGSALHSAHFPHKHRDTKPLAGYLTGQEVLPALWQMPAFAIMLRTLMRQETGAQKHRMLAVLLTQGIHTFVQGRKPLHADGFSKEIKLAVVGLGELQEDDPGGAVRSQRIEEVLEGLRHSPENVIGKLRGSGEIDLKSSVPKLLRPEENHHPLGGEFIPPSFDAGVLNRVYPAFFLV